MDTVVNLASIVQYYFLHDPFLCVKNRLKYLRRSIMMFRDKELRYEWLL